MIRNHIASVSKTVYIEIRKLKQMANFIISTSSLHALSFTLSRLDYRNSLFSKLCSSCYSKSKETRGEVACIYFIH